MDDNWDFTLRLDVDLKLEASLSVVIFFWEMPNIKKAIQNYFLGSKNWSDKWLDRTDWCKIQDTVLKNVNTLYLPSKILKELHSLVFLIGEKIFNWYQYIMLDLELDCKFGNKIYWTSYAKIDEGRIFREFWQNRPDFHSHNRRINELGSSLFMVACLFGQEDFVKNNLEEMAALININTDSMRKVDVYLVITSWLNFYFYLPKNSSKKTLLLHVLQFGLCSSLAKFLIKKFNIETSQNWLNSTIYECWHYCSKPRNEWKRENLLDIALLIFNKTSLNSEMCPFHGLTDCIRESGPPCVWGFLQAWPYHKLVSKIFKYQLRNGCIDVKYYEWLLFHLINMVLIRPQVSKITYESINEDMFIDIVQIIPNELKQGLFLKYLQELCFGLFDTECYNVVSYLIDYYPDLKDKIIDIGYLYLKTIFNPTRFKHFKEHMFKLTVMDGDRTRITNYCYALLDDKDVRIKIRKNFIRQGEFDMLDELLSCLSDYSDCEQIQLKKKFVSTDVYLSMFVTSARNCNIHFRKIWGNRHIYDMRILMDYWNWQFDSELDTVDLNFKINVINFCYSISRIDPDCVDDMLDWHSGDSDTNRLQCMKFRMSRDHEFMCKRIIDIWWLNHLCMGEECANNECLKCLNWILETDEEIIAFRKGIVNRRCFFTRFFLYSQNVTKEAVIEIHEKFLKFCTVSQQKIRAARQKLYGRLGIEF